jgi:hypothetical protein
MQTETQRTATVFAVLFLLLLVANNWAIAGEKTEVFIYCANENSPDDRESKNYAIITEWLLSSEIKTARKISSQLAMDREKFPAVVDEEIADIKRHLPKTGNRLRAVIFTNRLVRTGHYLILDHNADEFQQANIDIPKHENYILNSNPLSQPAVLKLILQEVARKFDPAEHRFILLTKSHGNKKKAMTPRLVVRNEETSREEVLKMASGNASEGEPPAWAGKLGVTKEEYFSILAEAGSEQKMQFSLVVVESCKGDINDELTQELPGNVTRLFNSGPRPAQYSSLKYAELLSDMDGNRLFSDLIGESLSDRFQELHHEAKRFPYELLLLFLPLLIWGCWKIARRKKMPTVIEETPLQAE